MKKEPRPWRSGADLSASIDALRRVFVGATKAPGDIPSGEETREMLGLFARLPGEDLRRAVLDLMRTIVDRHR